mmetsp:Transcript_57671/g.135809  ORF Transcript_57671/g.135809 Transcript_57671/m.135809 type:complete len:213 (+) Transcript_57671:2755-3393(+)
MRRRRSRRPARFPSTALRRSPSRRPPCRSRWSRRPLATSRAAAAIRWPASAPPRSAPRRSRCRRPAATSCPSAHSRRTSCASSSRPPPFPSLRSMPCCWPGWASWVCGRGAASRLESPLTPPSRPPRLTRRQRRPYPSGPAVDPDGLQWFPNSRIKGLRAGTVSIAASLSSRPCRMSRPTSPSLTRSTKRDTGSCTGLSFLLSATSTVRRPS